MGHDIFLARAKNTDFFKKTTAPLTLEYLTETGWQTNATYDSLKKIISAESDSALSIVKNNNGIHMISKHYSMLGDTIVDFHAQDYDQPFTATDILEVPVRTNSFSYGIYVHQNIVGNKYWATLNYNTNQDVKKTVSSYRPELLVVELAGA